jgi:Family of unknown function (DUF5683)
MGRTLAIGWLCLLCWGGRHTFGQTSTLPTDSLRLGTLALSMDSLKKKPKIIPRKATIRALMCPGLGQIYNRQYWKLPLVYGGLGATLGIAFWNNNNYSFWLEQFRVLSRDPSNPNYVPPSTVAIDGRNYTLGNVTAIKDGFRRNRDYSYVFLILMYGLQAVDANVSAHLKTFDMTDDISLHLEPDIRQVAFGQQPVMGAKLVLAF